MMNRDHSRTFYQEAMAGIFAKDLMKHEGVFDVIITAALDRVSGFRTYTVCWNEGWSLKD